MNNTELIEKLLIIVQRLIQNTDAADDKIEYQKAVDVVIDDLTNFIMLLEAKED